MRHFIAFLAAVFCLGLPIARAGESSRTLGFDRSVIQMEVTRKQFDYVQPWTKRVDQVTKVGTMVGPREILTTADYLSDLTLLRLQKGGRGKWYEGELVWIDYHANLAIVSSKDESFWKDMRPVKLAEVTPSSGAAQVGRWRNGNFELRPVDLNRMIVNSRGEGKESTKPR